MFLVMISILVVVASARIPINLHISRVFASQAGTTLAELLKDNIDVSKTYSGAYVLALERFNAVMVHIVALVSVLALGCVSWIWMNRAALLLRIIEKEIETKPNILKRV
jgi:hypothetical protein